MLHDDPKRRRKSDWCSAILYGEIAIIYVTQNGQCRSLSWLMGRLHVELRDLADLAILSWDTMLP